MLRTGWLVVRENLAVFVRAEHEVANTSADGGDGFIFTDYLHGLFLFEIQWFNIS